MALFCPTGDEQEELLSLDRLVVVAVFVSALPLVAFFYSVIVWSAYSFFGEIRWKNRKSFEAIGLRWILVVLAWVASCGVAALCGTCGETIAVGDASWWSWCRIGTTLLLAAVFGGVSAKLLLSTRRQDVVGVDPDEIPFYGSKSLDGKFMVVTGANTGIGFETTRQLAAQGATIAMLCRNPKRAHKAMNDIVELQAQLHTTDPIQHPGIISIDQLLFVPLDLTDFDSIEKATEAIGQHLEQRKKQTSKAAAAASAQQPSSQIVDALVCNAGLMMGTQSTTKDGLETMMQANHLGHFLLMKRMLDQGMLKTTTTKKGSNDDKPDEPSRVCILTSSTYLFAASTTGFDFVDPYCSTGHRAYTLFGQYSMTKLANLLIARELARRYNSGSGESETALAVFAVHPGVVRTNVTSNMNWYYRWGNKAFAWIVGSISKTPAEGAYSSVYTVARPLSQIPFWKKGSFVSNCKEQTANDYVEGPNGSLDSTKLWEWSEKQLQLSTKGKTNGDNTKNKDAGEKKEQ